METIHGAELVLLSFPEQNAGEYLGGLLTIATPMEKNWHWLRAEDYANMDEMLLRALDYAKSIGMDHVHVMECTIFRKDDGICAGQHERSSTASSARRAEGAWVSGDPDLC